jgi:hypothetical protein
MQQTFILPYLRTSPIHIPRRDLVLGQPDSLSLSVSIVETDDPDALPIVVTGGVGGPLLTLFIWPASYQRSWGYGGRWGYGAGWDYGAGWWTISTMPLWSGDFTISDAPSATFGISFPPGTMATWPRRACWSMQLTDDHGASVSQLAWGDLHVMPGGQRVVTQPIAIITDPGSTILVA